MNKDKYNQIIHEVYNNFLLNASEIKDGYECGDIIGSQPHIDMMFSNPETLTILTQEEFIYRIKTNKEFSESWGLKIEERNLTYSERYKIWFGNNYETGMEYDESNTPEFDNEYYTTTPTKLITITYNDKTIESYEN
jgi:hypothetical protein